MLDDELKKLLAPGPGKVAVKLDDGTTVYVRPSRAKDPDDDDASLDEGGSGETIEEVLESQERKRAAKASRLVGAECEVTRLTRTVNLGNGRRVSVPVDGAPQTVHCEGRTFTARTLVEACRAAAKHRARVELAESEHGIERAMLADRKKKPSEPWPDSPVVELGRPASDELGRAMLDARGFEPNPDGDSPKKKGA